MRGLGAKLPFAYSALEYCPIILVIRLERCNDYYFASKVEGDVKSDFFNAEDAECAEIRCGPLRNFGVFALEYCPIILVIRLERCNDYYFASKVVVNVKVDFF